MIALRPEPQTLLIVVALVVTGRPPSRAAWRAGAWPAPACMYLADEDLVDQVPSGRPPRSIAARTATPAELDRRTAAIAPPNLPIGVAPR